MKRIKVRVMLRAGRKAFEAQWEDPITGKKKTRTTEQTSKKEAVKFAAVLEEKLNNDELAEIRPQLWRDVIAHYRNEVMPEYRPTTRAKIETSISAVAKLIDPKYLTALTAPVIGQFSAALRKKELSEFTVRGHLTNLKRILQWCAARDWIRKCPEIKLPKRLKPNKGRPITAEEFERFLMAIPKVVDELKPSKKTNRIPELTRPPRAHTWSHFAIGMWLSGLRLGESLRLHWTDLPFCVETGEYWMLRIMVRGEKGRTSRMLPLAPEFEEFLRATPEEERNGWVFNPKTATGLRPPLLVASKTLSAVGRKAGILTGETTRGKQQFASSHDLRRSFGDRWARRRISQSELKQMMRHASIQTTLEFYADLNSEETAESARQALVNTTAAQIANTFANSPAPESPRQVDLA